MTTLIMSFVIMMAIYLLNKGVHIGVEQVTENADPCKDMLKRKYLKLIALERKTPREALIYEESGQVLEDISCVRWISNSMVEHFVHLIKSMFEMRYVRKLYHILDIQVKQIKDFINNS